MKNDLIAPALNLEAALPESLKFHVRVGHFSMLKHAASAIEMPNHTVKSVYSVYDAYQRKVGVIFSASYDAEKRVTWFAADMNGEVSSSLLVTRLEALRVLEVMWARNLLTGGMSKAKSVLFRH